MGNGRTTVASEVHLIGMSKVNLPATTWRDVEILMWPKGRELSNSSSLWVEPASPEQPACGPSAAQGREDSTLRRS